MKVLFKTIIVYFLLIGILAAESDVQYLKNLRFIESRQNFHINRLKMIKANPDYIKKLEDCNKNLKILIKQKSNE